ncbi:hypothetical protein O7543_17210 [Solwaraspora sp. WMMA2080]|uniref:hypothetical protein n=1 Tax=Solwaraspora sp. WMMA2080 TaxID=3015165 RepID=UPI00248AA2C4|nr:hypothetical protein [Solwaraspora sp. WMMA2080]WBC18663.1 hypothetical protein O7543_17210 [Solwaraspora sp. WMMA2080]
MSVDDVKRTVELGNEAVRQGCQILEQALAEAAEAGALARATMHDSAHDEVEKAKAKLDSLEREVELAIRRFEATAQNANDHVAKL